MRHNLPQQYRNDPWVIALTNAMQGVMETQETRAKDVTVQQSLDTVSWNLPVEERIVGISPRPDATEDERRAALKAKWRSGGKLTIEQIQAVADAWKDGSVVVSFVAGRIILQFSGVYGVPENMDILQAAIRVVTPAHLPIDYRLKHILVKDIHNVMSLDMLAHQKISNFAFGEGG